MSALRKYAVTVMVVDRYWSIDVLIDAQSAEHAKARVQQRLDELPGQGVTGSFAVASARVIS